MYPTTYMTHILLHVCLWPDALLSIDYDHIATASRTFADDSEVRQLEKGLPRWEGFGEQGWMDEVSQVGHYLDITFIATETQHETRNDI